jgi:hypothetical protein
LRGWAVRLILKEAHPNACSEVWAAAKDTLGNPENYTVKITDESRMTASYTVKHSAHVTVTGALRQRPNTVSLSSKGTGCEMEVQSNYSGFEHNDAGDFVKRVNEFLAKLKGSTPSAPAKAADAKEPRARAFPETPPDGVYYTS